MNNPTTIIEMLRYRAEHQPSQTAYILLSDADGTESKVSYQQLDEQARGIAATLTAERPTARCALLLLPTSIEYLSAFFGCLYAGIPAIPAYLPNRRRRDHRIEAIVANAQPDLILTNVDSDRIDRQLADFDRMASAGMYVHIGFPHRSTTTPGWTHPLIDGETLAYLQYTSGSTRSPRGTMVTHGNLLHNLALMHKHLGPDRMEAGLGVSWLPLHHDMGMVGMVLSALYLGRPLVLMSPTAFAQNPLRWLQAISDYRAMVSAAPCSAFQFCVDRIKHTEHAELDLTSWEVAVVGAEPIRLDTLKSFAHSFAPFGFRYEFFRTGYGLAEATLFVSSGIPVALEPNDHLSTGSSDIDSSRVVSGHNGAAPVLTSSGQLSSAQELVIVNPDTLRPLPARAEGEIWVAGPSVARGYWQRPDETTATFHARLAGSNAGPYLRTGDLGFIHGENLYITGRIKDLVIINGINHHPQDIEYFAHVSHPRLAPDAGIAFSVTVDGQEQLVIVHEVERRFQPVDASSMVHAIRQTMAKEFGLAIYDVVLLKYRHLPRTSSGKPQRSRCKRLYLEGQLDSVLFSESGTRDLSDSVDWTSDPADQAAKTVAAKLIAIWAGVLGEEIGLHDDFLKRGVQSIVAAQVVARIRDQFHINLPISVLFDATTIAELAIVIESRLSETLPHLTQSVQDSDPESVDPVSYSQERMWFLQQIDPHGSAYNMSGAVRLVGQLNMAVLRQSLDVVVQRHATLRTTFHMVEGELRPAIAPSQSIPFQIVDLRADTESDREQRVDQTLSQAAREPFDLSSGPLVRVVVIQLQEQEQILQLVTHHIISDAWSLILFAQQWSEAYERIAHDQPVPELALPIQYTNYAAWQRRAFESGDQELQLAYWRKQLADIPVLELPTDHPHSARPRNRGALAKVAIPAPTFEKLKQFSQQQNATLFMTMLAAFQTLLHRITGQSDLPVAVPVSGRDLPATEHLIGSFVNTVIVRSIIVGNPSFADLLQQVRQTTLEALNYQELPYARLVAELNPQRIANQSPLAQVMFNVINMPMPSLSLPGFEWNLITVDRLGAQFDLAITVLDLGNLHEATIEYNTDLFDAETVSEFLSRYLALLEGVVDAPNQPISQLSILSEKERKQVLSNWIGRVIEVPPDACVHHLFEAQAVRSANAVALVGRPPGSRDFESVSYGDLDRRSTQLAHQLRQLGCGPGTFVGVAFDRSIEMVVSLLGVLKAGAAYVPLDPTFPRSRLDHMIRDAGVTVILTQENLLEVLPKHKVRIVCLDTQWDIISKQPETSLENRVGHANHAYILFTSGSTGQPKGVQISHGALANFLSSMQQEPGFGPDDILVAVTTLSFDIAALELFLPLISGGQLILADRQTAADGAQLIELLEKFGATVVQATPATWRMLLDAGWQGSADIKMLCGGEALSRSLADDLLARGDALWNMYGPTETTIWSSTYRVESGDDLIHLGRPIANTQFYILDPYLHPTPVGVPGELYIGGDGLATGYLNRPELTAERFVPSPFRTGERIYRTGDRVRSKADGVIEFLGRLDSQVKIRGFRIELEEVRLALLQHDQVKQAAVITQDSPGGDTRLCAFYVPLSDHIPTTQELRTHLSEILPAYMVPAHYQCLPELPLTHNGKSDRRALASRIDWTRIDVQPVPARDPKEQLLVDIWKDLFQRPTIGVNDNFFDLGGDSLLAVRMFARVAAVYGRQFPVFTIFQFPTIKELSAVFRDADNAPVTPIVAPLNQGDHNKPFFIVHGIGGDVIGYRELAEELELECAMYGLRARGTDGEAEPHTSIEEMAAYYVAAIRAVRPHGPYHLAGYCYGGVVAYEMARQLEQQGETVGTLAILEGYAPNTRVDRWRPNVILSTLRNIPLWLRDYGLIEIGRGVGTVSMALLGSWREGIRSWDTLTHRSALARVLEDSMGLPRHRIQLIEAHLHAIRSYQPQPLAGRLVLFRVRAMSLTRAYNPDMGWGQLARGGVEPHILPGTHFEILQYPHVRQLATELRDLLSSQHTTAAEKS